MKSVKEKFDIVKWERDTFEKVMFRAERSIAMDSSVDIEVFKCFFFGVSQTFKNNNFFSESMEEFQYELKMPKDRVAVLIGKKGEIKKELEHNTRTHITVDSKEGDVFVRGNDAISLYTAKEIVTAIARGFNPEVAQSLLKQDYCFELIRTDDFVKSKNSQLRLKGRVIGRDGKSRRTIETLTDTYICVYGKTIGIIGLSEDVTNAKRAVESLLSGSPHSNVFRWLEKMRRDKKRFDIEDKDD
jgi:ribosomal RNA assembly protein